ncbi:MAG: BamA/TamA family outer membrane protein [Paludibacter sp.]|nr:BamA/TamA family outer membrane protein [Paludibacter sp.]
MIHCIEILKGSSITKVIVFLFLFILCHLQLLGQENYVIKKIHFQGNTQFTKAELLDKIATTETNFINKYILKKEPTLYNAEYAMLDVEQLKVLYQSQGFMNAIISFDSIHQNDKKKIVELFYNITENKPYRIKNIDYNYNNIEIKLESDSLLKSVRNFLLIRKNGRFVDNKLMYDVDRITTTLQNKGYVYAKTNYKLKLNTDSNWVNITFDIESGQKCQLGAISIEGNTFVKTKFIESIQTLREGDPYNNKKIERVRKNLYNLDLFRIVSIIPERNNDTKLNPIPIRIFLQEMPRWSAKFSGGWGNEDKLRVAGDFTWRSIFGNSRRLNLVVKHSDINPYYASLMWIEPHFFVNDLSFVINPYFKKNVEPGYTSQAHGIDFPINYKINNSISTSFSYYLERIKQDVDSTDIEITNPENNKFQYNKSGLLLKTTFNYASPSVSPTTGWTLNVGAKINGYLLGSDFNYTRWWGDLRFYQKWGKFSFAERCMIGTAQSSDSAEYIPVEDRFYSGGINSNRGWGRWQIGPKRANGTPLGGKSILESNFEVRHPLFWKVELAAFMDASNVWYNDAIYRFKDLNVAIGGGLRVNTPIGPLRFDIGCPVWNEKRKIQFNISVGQAF